MPVMRQRHGKWQMANGKWWRRQLSCAIFLLPFPMLFAVSAHAVAKTSNGTGNWGAPAEWSPVGLPAATDSVTIRAVETVAIDISTATASTTTVLGKLQFSTVKGSTFTLVNGSMTVAAGGTLTLGTAASPIPVGSTATLVLAYGSSAGQYGLTINPGGNFVVYGSTRKPW